MAPNMHAQGRAETFGASLAMSHAHNALALECPGHQLLVEYSTMHKVSFSCLSGSGARFKVRLLS